MKLIKKDGVVLMKAYEINELDEDIKDEIIDEFVQREPSVYGGWFGSDIVGHIMVNNYLFTEEGEMLPINFYTEDTELLNEVVKTTLRIAGEEVEVNIVNGNKTKVKQIIVDVELEGKHNGELALIKSSLKSKIKNAIENTEGAVQISDLNYIDMTKEYKEAGQ